VKVGARLVVTYVDGTEVEVTAHIGDLTRMSQKFGPGWQREVENDPLPYASYLAWLGTRHADAPQRHALAPFPDAAGNGSRSSWPSSPAPTPEPGWTPTPASP
jgi:hypothetical protein